MNFLQFDSLKEIPELVHGVSMVPYGNMADPYQPEEDDAWGNRYRFFTDIGAMGMEPLMPKPKQGYCVIDAADMPFPTQPSGDIIITNRPGILCAFNAADCPVVILVDPIRRVLCLAHSGLEGTSQFAVQFAIFEMCKRYGCEHQDLRAVVPPAIQAHSYVYNRIPMDKLHGNIHWMRFKHIYGLSDGAYAIDNVGYVKQQLLDAGVSEARIYDCEIDTYSDPRFYSHRLQSHIAKLYGKDAKGARPARFCVAAGFTE